MEQKSKLPEETEKEIVSRVCPYCMGTGETISYRYKDPVVCMCLFCGGEGEIKK